jgi:hypothetical protein
VTAVNTRPDVSMPELQRAWRAVQAGKFRQESPAAAARADAVQSSRTWAPGNAQQVLPVVGCAGRAGSFDNRSRIGERRRRLRADSRMPVGDHLRSGSG